MDMWLCMKRAIMVTERAKKAYEDGRSKVVEAGKVLKDHANLVKDNEALEQQGKAAEAKLSEIRATLDAAIQAARDEEAAKEEVEVVMEDMEWSKAAEVEAAVQHAITQYNSSDKEVGLEMVNLIHRFKRFNPSAKLNLNFVVDPPPLPEGVIVEMIKDYEGEDAPTDADRHCCSCRCRGCADRIGRIKS
ncbi:unnamed protein product [Prunus armeniaca]